VRRAHDSFTILGSNSLFWSTQNAVVLLASSHGQTERNSSNMSLCSCCSSINLRNITATFTDSGYSDDGSQTQQTVKKSMVHLQRASDLIESAKNCSLCALMEEELSRGFSKGQDEATQLHHPTGASNRSAQLLQNLSSDPLVVGSKLDPLGYAFPYSRARGTFLSGITVAGRRRNNDKSDLVTGSLRLFTRHGMRSLRFGIQS
jgi:hypothetical protein